VFASSQRESIIESFEYPTGFSQEAIIFLADIENQSIIVTILRNFIDKSYSDISNVSFLPYAKL